MNQTNAPQNKMGTASMFPLIVSMALPAMFSMMIQALYNIVDSYFVSSYSTKGLSAVSLALPIQNLIIAFAVGTSIGSASLVSRKLGANERTDANSAATHGLVLNMLSWLIFLLIGLFGCDYFYRLFETDEQIIAMGTTYMCIVSSFSLFAFMQVCFEKTLQSTGNMIFPMLIQLVGAVTNIILDPILIFGYFGFPEMGVAGAAIATVTGQFLGACLGFAIIFSKKHRHEIEINLKGFRFDPSMIKQIYTVGFPSIVMNAIGTVMLMSINGILAAFSTAAYTVYGLYFKLQSFVFMPVFGLNSGLMPILGYNYGAKNKKRIMSCLKVGVSIALVINCMGMLLFMIMPAQLLGIFNPTQEILDIGITALRIIALIYPLAAINIVMATLFQALGKGTYSLINSVLRQLVLIIPLAYLFSKISLTMVWVAFPCSEVGALLVSLYYLVKLYKEKIKPLG